VSLVLRPRERIVFPIDSRILRINYSFRKKEKKFKKKYFFIILTKNFTTQKILKMENKHPEHFGSA
jgi:hypothetical protein